MVQLCLAVTLVYIIMNEEHQCVFVACVGHCSTWSEWWTYEGISGKFFCSFVATGMKLVHNNLKCLMSPAYSIVNSSSFMRFHPLNCVYN